MTLEICQKAIFADISETVEDIPHSASLLPGGKLPRFLLTVHSCTGLPNLLVYTRYNTYLQKNYKIKSQFFKDYRSWIKNYTRPHKSQRTRTALQRPSSQRTPVTRSLDS